MDQHSLIKMGQGMVVVVVVTTIALVVDRGAKDHVINLTLSFMVMQQDQTDYMVAYKQHKNTVHPN